MKFLKVLCFAGALGCCLAAKVDAQVTPGSVAGLASGQHFVCNIGYTIPDCRRDINTLQQVLQKYPVSQLGEWTWVLVRSADWHAIQAPRNLDPHSPAFTYYPARETFLEEALLSDVGRRRFELHDSWRMDMAQLLDYVVAHELAHALCDEPDENKARKGGVLLLEQHRISCEVILEARQNQDGSRKPLSHK